VIRKALLILMKAVLPLAKDAIPTMRTCKQYTHLTLQPLLVDVVVMPRITNLTTGFIWEAMAMKNIKIRGTTALDVKAAITE